MTIFLLVDNRRDPTTISLQTRKLTSFLGDGVVTSGLSSTDIGSDIPDGGLDDFLCGETGSSIGSTNRIGSMGILMMLGLLVGPVVGDEGI